jgi:predicted O-methyltransferase YrrM
MSDLLLHADLLGGWSTLLFDPLGIQPVDNIVGMMNDTDIPRVPAALEGILRDTGRIGFTMASERKTGSLLRTLAASKPAGRFLELGTGTGVGTSWILAGMDAGSKLDSIDNDPATQEIARRHLGPDSRVTFHVVDGADFLERSDIEPYDFVYADSWPGKFSHLDLALGLLRAGGIYLIDDLLPQANWPPGHDVKVAALIEELQAKRGFVAVKLAWATGLMMVCREG